MGFPLSTWLALTAIALFGWIAVGDLRRREIPNPLVIAVFFLGLGKALLLGTGHEIMFDLGAAVIAFAVALPLFIGGFVGGGDAKLIPASVLFVGWDAALQFTVEMSLLGGVLSLAILAVRAAKRARARGKAGTAEPPTVPYGVAIAGAAVSAIMQVPPFLPSLQG